MFVGRLVARLLQCLSSIDFEEILSGVLVILALGYVFMKWAELYGEDTS
jgi:hypothetical protein